MFLFTRLNHPVKRFKTDENIPMEVDIEASWDDSSQRKGEDLYAGHNHTKMAPVDPQPCNGPLPYIKSEIKQEPNQVKYLFKIEVDLIFFSINHV